MLKFLMTCVLQLIFCTIAISFTDLFDAQRDLQELEKCVHAKNRKGTVNKVQLICIVPSYEETKSTQIWPVLARG